MKKILLSAFAIGLLAADIHAQQMPMYTQYMYNGLLINPAYAGNKLAYEFTGMHRRQFDGFDGAPKTQNFTFSMPVPKKNIGLGLKLMNETMGPAVSVNGIGLCYAYQIHFPSSRLSLGVEGSLYNQNIDFPSLRRTSQNDYAIPQSKESVFVPDASAGVYYDRERFFAGAAATNVFNHKYSYQGVYNRSLTGNLYRHYFIYTGGNIPISTDFKITPAVLLKYVTAAPVQVDVNAILTYKEMISLGGGFRSDKTTAVIFRYTQSQKISLGYSYDFATSQLGQYHFGNHEIMLTYRIAVPEPPGKKTVHPRYYF